MEHYHMNLTLKVWRQKNSKTNGSFETYQVKNISSEMSFLEMFDVLNEQLIAPKEKNPLLLTTTAGKVSAGCAVCISMDRHMVHGSRIQPASSICVPSKTAIPL
jgi:hypothetical protein